MPFEFLRTYLQAVEIQMEDNECNAEKGSRSIELGKLCHYALHSGCGRHVLRHAK